MLSGRGIHKKAHQVESLDEEKQRNCACQGHNMIKWTDKKHHSQTQFCLSKRKTNILLPFFIAITVNLHQSHLFYISFSLPLALLTFQCKYSTQNAQIPFVYSLYFLIYHQSNTSKAQCKPNSAIKNDFFPSKTTRIIQKFKWVILLTNIKYSFKWWEETLTGEQ